jgi:exosortase A-associated hydrolase 2
MPVQAFFLPVDGGQRFCVYHPAQGPEARGQIVYVHPFAEEMNKSRRMVAQQARHLSAAGFAVLQIDLLGCGDSSGAFGDVQWDAWVNDVLLACRWLREKAGNAPLWLWGLRAGCLLATEAAARLARPCHLLFWAPAPAGKPLLQQFMRLKAAGEMMGGDAKGVMENLRQEMAQGRPVEIAGYVLAPGLASGLEKSVLAPPAGLAPGRIEWFELTTRPDGALSPAVIKAQAPWQQAGFGLRSHLVQGPSFWQTTEIEDAPDLIPATTAALNAASTQRAAA